MVVASVVDGRVRIRAEGLKNEYVTGRVREELLGTEGVISVEGNPRVGSLLVLYNAAVTALDNILKAVSGIIGTGDEAGPGAEMEQGARRPGVLQRMLAKVKSREAGGPGESEEQGEPRDSWWRKMLAAAKVSPAGTSIMKRRVLNNIGMLASLTFSLIAALFDFKKLHILSGLLFLVLFGEHFYQRRARMFS